MQVMEGGSKRQRVAGASSKTDRWASDSEEDEQPQPVRSRKADSRATQQEPRHTEAKAAEETETTRSEEHTSELQSLMRISYAVFCLKKKKKKHEHKQTRKIQHKREK